MPAKKTSARLCLVSDHLSGGGAERVSAVLSQVFVEMGHEVDHVIVLDKIAYDFAGNMLNLGLLKDRDKGIIGRIRRFRHLIRFFRSNRFDYIIDTRVRKKPLQELIISRFVFNAPLVVLVHSYMTELYFPGNRLIQRNIFRKAFRIVGVSEKISEKIRSVYGYRNVTTVPNPVDMAAIEKKEGQYLDISFPFILAVGSMDTDVKQFDRLIMAYKKTHLPAAGVKLLFLGEGSNKASLIRLSHYLGLSAHIVFYGRDENPFRFYKNAIFTVLSSRNEGFPNVLAESLACGTPVVSFDCLSGPSEIIRHEQNGLLVPDQDFDAMAAAMDRLASDRPLYELCKARAKASVTWLDKHKIGSQWAQMLQI